ncbi:GATA transcription factor 1-like [Bidens hawaiensis]|uniref:GATA transcription factor 1-like n=1 Tax=Bidens hawaiensis TaxID=980011 RepID=UPI00404B41A8
MASSDLDSCLIVDDDDLLNFSLDDETKPPSSFTNPKTTLDDDNYNPSFPELAEEELEWLSNKDAFPALDDIFSNPNQTVTLSVIDNNSSSSGNSNSHSHSITSCCGSLQVPLNYPVRKRSNRRRRGRQCWWWNQVMEVTSSSLSLLSKPQATGAAGLGRRCQHCLAEKTPQWRAGPMGPKTLCNACGVRYKSGRLVAEYRPANSPSFSVKLHSNSHRKIMEMRKKMQAG